MEVKPLFFLVSVKPVEVLKTKHSPSEYLLVTKVQSLNFTQGYNHNDDKSWEEREETFAVHLVLNDCQDGAFKMEETGMQILCEVQLRLEKYYVIQVWVWTQYSQTNVRNEATVNG